MIHTGGSAMGTIDRLDLRCLLTLQQNLKLAQPWHVLPPLINGVNGDP